MLVLAVAIGGFFLLRTLVEPDEAAFGNVRDEVATVGLTGAYFKPAAEDYFARMDKGLLLKPAPGAPHPDQINEIATLAKLPPKRCGRRPSAVRTPGSSGPAAMTVSGISRRRTPSARSTC